MTKEKLVKILYSGLLQTSEYWGQTRGLNKIGLPLTAEAIEAWANMLANEIIEEEQNNG